LASILAIDDSISMRQMLSITLGRNGHDVTAAEDGEIALKRARARSFGLVIAVVRLPNLNGITLISELRKLSVSRPGPCSC